MLGGMDGFLKITHTHTHTHIHTHTTHTRTHTPTHTRIHTHKYTLQVGIANYSELAKGQMLGGMDGFLKIIFSTEDFKILGVHAIGEGATEIVHIGQVGSLCCVSKCVCVCERERER